MAGRATARRRPVGSHSHTSPFSVSSHDSQLAHGVPPPEQFCVVPDRMRYASSTSPSGPKRIADAPPSRVSELDTRIQPPPVAGKVAPPSEALCHS